MPSISIALATYNGAAFISEQLASLAAQVVLPAELVVSDDGSTDGTVAIVEDFAKGAPFPVRLEVNQHRLGYRSNFMKAAGLCRSEFISFCDQDDNWRPEKLATVIRQFTSDDIMLVTHNASIIDATGKHVGKLFLDPSSSSNDLIVDGPWPLQLGFTQTFRSSLMQHTSLWRDSVSHFAEGERIGHDRWIAFLSAAIGRTIVLTDELAAHRHHSSNVFGGKITTTWPSLRERINWVQRTVAQQIKAAQNRSKILESLPPTESTKTLKENYSFLLLLLKMRAEAIGAKQPSVRARALLGLHSYFAYSRGPWAFSRRDAIEDLLCAILPSS